MYYGQTNKDSKNQKRIAGDQVRMVDSPSPGILIIHDSHHVKIFDRHRIRDIKPPSEEIKCKSSKQYMKNYDYLIETEQCNT